jgi:hypothetical protein
MDRQIKQAFKKAKTMAQKCGVIRKYILNLDRRLDRIEEQEQKEPWHPKRRHLK